MNDTVSTVDGVQLCWQAFGDPRHPTLLLIAGGAQSMVWWEDDLCTRLARAGLHVSRYDHRDTGRSVSSPGGQPRYGSRDLATDPLRILDAAGVSRAHVVGLPGMGHQIPPPELWDLATSAITRQTTAATR